MSVFKRKRTAAVAEDNRVDNWIYMWMAIFMVGGYILFSLIEGFLGALVLRWICVTLIVVMLVFLGYMAIKKTTNEKRIVQFILLTSIILRLYYMIVTAQREYTGDDALMIKSMCDNFVLPNTYQPLYYVMAASINSLAGLTGFTVNISMELVRLVTEYMGIACAVTMFYILCELEVSDTATCMGTMIIAFHPGLIVLGGDIGSGMTVTMLLMFTILFLCRWNSFTDGYNFLLMSVCFGLAVMTDMSALLFLPTVLVLVIINLVRVFKRKRAFNIVSTMIQTVGGLAAWLVLSFCYPVWNMLRGKETGLMKIFTDIPKNVGSVDINKRFLSFSSNEMMGVYVSGNDKNAWAYLMKSSLFGDAKLSNAYNTMMQLFIMISCAAVIVAALMVISSIFARLEAKKKVNIWSLLALLASVIVYYFMLGMGNTKISALAFESVPIALAIGTAFIGFGIKMLGNKKKLSLVSRILYMLVILVCFAFCAASVAYGILIFE